MHPRLVQVSVLVLVQVYCSRSFPVCVWVSSVARSCATNDANNKNYVCKPTIPAGINRPPPSKTISPITRFGTIETRLAGEEDYRTPVGYGQGPCEKVAFIYDGRSRAKD